MQRHWLLIVKHNIKTYILNPDQFWSGFFVVMKKVIQLIQNLSIDITLGSIVMTLFVGEILEVNINFNMLLGLAIAIWLIYTTDHLLDAYKAKTTVVNPRHAFHQEYFKPLIFTATAAFAIGLWNLNELPERTIWIGVILALISLLYLLYSYFSSRGINKELMAAVVYALGVVAAPISLLESVNIECLILLIILTLLAYTNLLLVSFFEEVVDRTDQVQSVTIRKTRKGVANLIYFLMLILSVLITVGLLINKLDYAYVVFLVMVLILFVVLKCRSKLSDQYRLICDGIFFIPLIYLL